MEEVFHDRIYAATDPTSTMAGLQERRLEASSYKNLKPTKMQKGFRNPKRQILLT